MKEIRVLHIYRTYFPETQGGAQEGIRQFCLATQGFGVQNTVFALARDPFPAISQREEGGLVRARAWLELASCDIGGLSALRRCHAAARDADIIQLYYPWPFADAMLPFIRRPNQPLLVTYMSDIVRQGKLGTLYAPLRNWMLGSASTIAATSPTYASTSPVLKQFADKVCVIPHCLDAGPAPDPERLAYWRARFGESFFLFVGVLRYYKGLHVLIEAARQVSSPIVIVGDGPEASRLKAMADGYGLKQVHFTGALPDADKIALNTLCRAVVFPSHLRSEAFGITLLEGARAGKPLISCEIGTGTSWVNQHGESGLVIPPADPGALASAMNLLARDDEACTRFGQGAYRRWAAHFTPRAVGARCRQVYDALLDGTRIPDWTA